MYPSRWRKAIKKPSLARVFKTRAHVGYNLIKAVLLYSRVYLKFARLVWRRIFRPFERINDRSSQDRSPDDSFEWWDEERGIFHQDSIGKKHSIRSVDFIFLAASPPLPSPCRGNNARFPWRAVDPTSISRWRLRPRFISSALVKFEGERGREKKKKNSVIVQISRRNRKLWRKFFERRSKARSVSVLCPWNIVRPAIKRSSDRWML